LDLFIDLTLIGPDLAILDPIFFQHFYEGLSKDSREFLDLSSGGAFLHLLTSEAGSCLKKLLVKPLAGLKFILSPPRKGVLS
jgi:hypothetical protein